MLSSLQNPDIDEQVTQYVRHLAETSRLVAGSRESISADILGHGFNNRLYEITTETHQLVVKVYPHGREMRMYREYAALQLLEPVEAVPQVIWGEPNARFLERPVLLCQKAPGGPIPDSGVQDDDLDHLTQVWDTIHRMEPPRDGPLCVAAGPQIANECLEYIDREIIALSQIPVTQTDRFQDALNRLKEYRQCLGMLDLQEGLWRDRYISFCQVDCRLENIIKDGEGTIRLIDWEHAGLMDPAYEIAGFFQRPESFDITPEQRNRCIQLYCDYADDPTIYGRIAVYLTILPVQWVARILSILTSEDIGPVQPWVTPRTSEELWEDLERYSEVSRDVLDGKLLY